MWKLLLIAASLSWGQHPEPPEKPFTFPEFKECGLVTRYSSNKIPASCLTSANNVLFDEDFSLLRRNGFSKYNNTGCAGLKSVRGLWAFDATDGTHYMVVFSSQSMFQTSGGGDCTAISGLSSLSLTAEMQCVQALGRLWCTDGTDTPFYWDGTSTATVSAMPKGKYIGTFRNRVVTSNVSGNLTILYLSGENDGTDWTLFIPGRSTSAAQINISGTNDGNSVSCLLGEYQNAFYIGRQTDLYALYGYDRRDFTLRKISKEVGCTEPKSVQEKNNALYWVSKRGVEKLSGTSIERVSDPIRPIIDNIISSAGNLLTKTLTTQSDFQGGNSSACASGPGACMSTTISPANVVPSSFSNTDATNTAWNAGTSVQVSTFEVSGTLSLAIASGSFTNGGFQNAGASCNNVISVNDWPTQTGTYYAGSCDTTANFTGPLDAIPGQRNSKSACLTLSGCPASCLTPTVTASVLDTDGNVLNSASGLSTIQDRTFDLSGTTVALVKMKFTAASGVFELTSKLFNKPQTLHYITGNSATDYAGSACGTQACNTDCSGTRNVKSMVVDLPEGEIYYNSGTYTSPVFDTTFSTPVFGPFAVSQTSSTQIPITFQTKTSVSSNGSFTSASQAVDGTISAPSNRFLQYIASFSTTVSTKTPTLSVVTLSAATTGYYISDCATPSSAITSWGNFRTNTVPNGGSFTFWTATGTTCARATATNANWVSQPANSAIAVATSTFIASRALFTLSSASQTPTLNDITFEWNEGTSRPATASAVYRDRYFLFYTTSTTSGAVNDHGVVADSQDKWSVMDDINAYSATIYNRKLYTGDSNSTGVIYQQDSGSDDNGSAFTEYIHTADLDFGNPAERKILKTIYVYLHPPSDATQSIMPTFNYYIDGSTVPYSLGSVSLAESAENSGFFVGKLAVATSQASTFHWISLDMTYTGTSGPLRLYGIQVIYEPIDWE